MSLQLSERTVGDVVVVDLSGKITLGEGGDAMLKDKVRSLLQQGRKKLVLNLGGVSYIDSAGLGELVQAYAATTKHGGALKLLNTTKRIKDLLSITKLLTVFETFENEGEAVTSFSAAV
jgi:anti-sigma B factor antagonist